jgi:hypothetical protein
LIWPGCLGFKENYWFADSKNTSRTLIINHISSLLNEHLIRQSGRCRFTLTLNIQFLRPYTRINTCGTFYCSQQFHKYVLFSLIYILSAWTIAILSNSITLLWIISFYTWYIGFNDLLSNSSLEKFLLQYT